MLAVKQTVRTFSSAAIASFPIAIHGFVIAVTQFIAFMGYTGRAWTAFTAVFKHLLSGCGLGFSPVAVCGQRESDRTQQQSARRYGNGKFVHERNSCVHPPGGCENAGLKASFH
jgi:hypothetical protein